MINIKSLLAGLLAGAFFIGAASAQTGQLGAGQVWGNPNAAQGVAVPASVSAILDRALGSTRGAILERGASGWAIVGPGSTAGLAWITAGTGADPAYGILGLSGGGCNAALTASNGGILYSTASACSILAGTATARLPLLSGASTTPVWGAYTLPASVTSGGVPYFSSTSAQGSSALLVANQIMLGGGAGLPPATLGSLGTTTTVLHGNAGGAPTFGSVSLTADVINQLPIANGGCNGTTAATCLNNITPTPTRAGDLMYWNGSAWVALAGNNSGTNFLQENPSGVPSWVSVAGTGTVTTPGGGLVSSTTAGCSQTANLSTLSASECVNAQSGTSYTIADGDRAKLITATNAAAQAYTIPQAGAGSAFVSGWFTDVQNNSTNVAGIITITPTTSTINGAATLKIQPGQYVRIVSDGTNFQVMGLPNARQVPGTTTNDSANSGNVGEYISSEILIGSAVSLTTSVTANITSVSLTAGDWQCQGNIYVIAAGTITTVEVGIGTTSATMPTRPGSGGMAQTVVSSSSQIGLPTGSRQMLLSGTTTVYLMGTSQFTSTGSAYGFLGCRRMR